MSNTNMRSLVKVVNRLQDACARSQVRLGLELPQICVVGGQSVGKSSVLESIVGRDFLPRGTGIVTRCPLILQCKQSEDWYAIFLHDNARVITDFDDVRREISAQTQRLCGSNKGIKDTPISLTIYSPHVLDLTLVDLPGITRVAIGDQPDDIEAQTLELVYKYARQQNVIILAVSAANVDLANSDAMKVVKEVDPQGERSIGVITKLDIMDPGTDARDILCNQQFPLKLGYIGVLNRGQEDIKSNLSVQEIRSRERQFFSSHQAYRDLSERMGNAHLQQVLSEQLSQHIARTLPDIMNTINTKKLQAGALLEEQRQDLDPETIFTRLLWEYGRQIQTEVKGTPDRVGMDEVAGGARLKQLFHNDFMQKLDLDNFLHNDEDFHKKILVVIQNLHAIQNGIFIPDEAFRAVVRLIIQRYEEPVSECVAIAAQALQDITDRAATILHEHPRLRDAVKMIVDNHIKDNEKITRDHLLVHVQAEAHYHNTRHVDFLSNVTRMSLPALVGESGVKHKHHDGTRQVPTRGRVQIRYQDTVQEAWVVVTADTIKCFKNKEEEGNICFVNLNDKTRMRTENGSKSNVIIIGRLDKEESEKIVLVFAKDQCAYEEWLRRLERHGILLEDGEELQMLDPRQGAAARVPEHSDHNRQATDKRLFTKDEPHDEDIDTVKQMVSAYLCVVAKTIQDIVPKYIVYLLVEDTENFANRDLSSRLRTQFNSKSLLERDAASHQRIEQLVREYSTSEDALRIIREYYASLRLAAAGGDRERDEEVV